MQETKSNIADITTIKINRDSTNAKKSNFVANFKDFNPKERLFRHQRHLAANKCEDIFRAI